MDREGKHYALSAFLVYRWWDQLNASEQAVVDTWLADGSDHIYGICRQFHFNQKNNKRTN